MKDLEERNGCNDDAVVVDSFIEFSTSHQYLLFPAFQMQLLLRTKVMGITFWEQQSMRRLKTCDGKYLKLEDYLSFVSFYFFLFFFQKILFDRFYSRNFRKWSII